MRSSAFRYKRTDRGASSGGRVREQDGWGRQGSAGVRTSPTGRVPRWVVDEARGVATSPEPWRAWSPAQPRPRRRGRPVLRGLLVVVALVAAGAVLQRLGVTLPGAGIGGPSAVLGFPHPTAGVEESGHPLGTPMAAPAGGGAFDFVAVQSGGRSPVSYDPCRPVHYVVRPDNAPAGGRQLIAEAIARVSSVTGLHFVDDGSSEEQPAKKRAPYQPDRYGDRWAPVLISWDTTAEDPDLAADVAGEAGSDRVAFPGEPTVYVTGTVSLDAAQLGQLMSNPRGAGVARAIVLHELGHLVGLAHVTDRTQLMYPEASTAVLDYAPGDLAGLSRLGAGACVPEV